MQRRHLLAAGLGAATFTTVRAAEPGVGDTEILFGQTAILSGPLGAPIKTMMAGAELAFADVRAAGGVHGRTPRIVSLDDELKPDRAVANAEKLLGEHKVFGFFGCVGSATTAATARVLQQSGAPAFGGYAVADSAREKVKGSAYFLRATSGREAQALVQHLTTIGITRIAVAVLDNPGGQEARTLLETALQQHQLRPLAVAAVTGDGSNIAEAAKAVAGAEPQTVIMYLAGVLPGELMKATWALGSRPMFYGMSIVAGEVTAKVAGEKARGLAISQIVPYPWGEVDPVVKDYRRLAEKANVPLGYYSFEGYANALVLLEALRRAGRDLTRAKLHAVLRGLKMRVAGMEIDFGTGSNTGSRYVELVQVTREGRFVR